MLFLKKAEMRISFYAKEGPFDPLKMHSWGDFAIYFRLT